MPTVPKRARIFGFPHQDALFDAHLDDIAQEPSKHGADIVFDFQRLTLTSTPELVIRDGKPLEIAEGEYTPMRLRFRDGLWLRRTGIFSHSRHCQTALMPVASSASCTRASRRLANSTGLPWAHPSQVN